MVQKGNCRNLGDPYCFRESGYLETIWRGEDSGMAVRESG